MANKVTLPNGSEVEWLGDNLLLLLEGAALEALTASAFGIEGRVKEQIVQNDQIDTGFMVNTVYVSTPEQSSYDSASLAAGLQNPAEQMLEEVKPQDVNEEGVVVLVVVGAEYAVYQEMAQPFLYPSLVAESQEVGGKLVEQAKKRGA